MKKHLILFLILLSFTYGQDAGVAEGVSLEQVKELNTCMSKIDMSAFANMQKEAAEMQVKVKEMCKKGKRDKAQNLALSYTKKMLNLPELKQLENCTKSFRPADKEGKNDDLMKAHVCDTGVELPKT